MNVQTCPWPAAVALALGLTLSGCTIGTPASGDVPSSVDRKKDRKERKTVRQNDRTQKTAAPKPKPRPKPAPKPPAKQVWVCSWSPTYDDDWHNDVLCDNGIASERPRLREGDDFVEQAEMMESAKEYARQRNAG
jgi:hypothetical protein